MAPQIEIENLSPYRRTDAIFVLGGAIYERYPYALELALEGFAPEVVVSNPNGAKDVWLTDLCDTRATNSPSRASNRTRRPRAVRPWNCVVSRSSAAGTASSS